MEYFVKWRNLPYSKCTWETIEEGIPDYEDQPDTTDSEEEEDEEAEENEETIKSRKARQARKDKKLKEKEAKWKREATAADIRAAVDAYWKHRQTIEQGDHVWYIHEIHASKFVKMAIFAYFI